MPLSFGIPLGLIGVLAGAVLYTATAHRKAAQVVMGIGASLALLTLALIVLAASAGM